MKKIHFVDENLSEFARRGRPPKVKKDMEDDWYASDDEFDNQEVGPSQIEDVKIEDATIDKGLIKEITRLINNELKISEFNRGELQFKLRTTGEKIVGVPMASLSNGKSYLFKTRKGLKKVKVNDMIFESLKEKQFVSESFKNHKNKQ